MRTFFPYIVFAILNLLACKSAVFKNSDHNYITLIVDKSLANHNSNTDSLGVNCFANHENHIEQESIYLGDNNQYQVFINKPIFFSLAGERTDVYKIYPGERVLIKREENYTVAYTILNDSVRNNETVCSKQLDDNMSNSSAVIFYKYRLTDSLSKLPGKNSEKEIVKDVANYEKGNYTMLDSLAAHFKPSRDFINNKMEFIQSDSLNHVYWLYDQFKNELFPGNLWPAKCKQLIKELNLLIDHRQLIYYANNVNSLFEKIKSIENVKSIKDSTGFINQYDVIENYFSGISKEYLLTTILYNSLLRRIVIPQRFFEKFKNSCRNKAYEEIVTRTQRKYEKLSNHKFSKNGNDLLSANSTRKTTLEKVLQSNEGRVIVIDFWASWCLPCRQELKHLQKVMEYYKGNNQLIFIGISIDKNIDSWRKTCLAENLNNNNFLMVDPNKSEFIDEQKIETIPRYILVNRSGKIVNGNAPLPSDAKLISEIETLLNSK